MRRSHVVCIEWEPWLRRLKGSLCDHGWQIEGLGGHVARLPEKFGPTGNQQNIPFRWNIPVGQPPEYSLRSAGRQSTVNRRWSTVNDQWAVGRWPRAVVGSQQSIVRGRWQVDAATHGRFCIGGLLSHKRPLMTN